MIRWVSRCEIVLVNLKGLQAQPNLRSTIDGILTYASGYWAYRKEKGRDVRGNISARWAIAMTISPLKLFQPLGNHATSRLVAGTGAFQGLFCLYFLLKIVLLIRQS